MDILILTLEIIGTLSFAASGALIAIKKDMDIFGVVVLGVITSVGGGILRDVILGNTPPFIFYNPVYPIVAVVTSIAIFLPFIRRPLLKNHLVYELLMIVMDSVGLGVFTVVGIQITYSVSDDFGFGLVVVMGMLSGVGGGVIRDVLAGDRPYIFVKHVYALASLLGAVVCTLMWNYNNTYALISGSLLTIIIRFCAAHFRWSLPKAHVDKSENL
ncbi:MAG: trimeric intracellular cation channel family protein [Clostridia bacterium]|nr:trimeric intracellular cation channel family protein [Clostridia bacterium]